MAQDKLGFAKHVQAGGYTDIISASYTRPSDTNAYTAGDVVANSTSAATILTFSNIARFPGGGGTIHAASLIDSSAQATKPEFDLFLFDTTVVMENDNAAWDPSDSEMQTCVGVLSFLAANFVVGNGNGITQKVAVGLPYTCTSAARDLYGIVVARNAYTPTSAEQFKFRLHVLQD